MNGWWIIASVVAATGLVSVGFWVGLMPRLAAKSLTKTAAMFLLATFAVVLIGIPVVGLALLTERSVPLICGLIVGWAMTVRGASWFIARKYFVPKLKAEQERKESEDAARPGS